MPEYRTPGVYIEEVSGGPRPVQAASTTNTGFVAVLTLPENFSAGRSLASGLLIPSGDAGLRLSWNRALAFRRLLAPADIEVAPAAAAAAPAGDKKDPAKPDAPKGAATESRLRTVIQETLGGGWTIQPAKDPGAMTLVSAKGDSLKVPASRTLLSVKTAEETPTWELVWGADDNKLVETLSGYAMRSSVGHAGTLGCVDGKAKPTQIKPDAIHERLAGPAPAITGMSGYLQWRRELGEKLFKEILLDGGGITEARAQSAWDNLNGSAKDAWDTWLRCHPGLFRLELALAGFFANGGATAYIACVLQTHGAGGPNKLAFLQTSFDSQPSVAMLAAPGLDGGWQQAILQYSGPKGRGDLFAVLEAPRYLMTQAPRDIGVDDFRWSKGDAPYEIGMLQTLDGNQARELRFLGFSNDELLDRTISRDDTGHGGAYGPWLIVDNPLSTGAHDRYVVCPPAGHVAGVIAGTDLRAGGGVHKAPANEQVMGIIDVITDVSDREQGALNMKSINIIRHRPGGGIRVWGARTTAADANWRYVNVRRLFLFVERSVKDAVNWAVFLPNTDTTRRDLATTIRSFLYSLWAQGMLDGASHAEAFSVQCDKLNNPDVDVRSGILTVDVQFRPPYPAEFVRIRFRQTPMESGA